MYLKNIETFQINNLILHLQQLEEQQQTQHRASRRKEIIKIRAELNDIETKRTIQKINESRSCFFEKINKIDKPLTRLIKKKKEWTQTNKIRNETGEITADITAVITKSPAQKNPGPHGDVDSGQQSPRHCG